MSVTETQASKVLGQNTNYPTSYDPSVLVPIERRNDRIEIGMELLDWTWGYDIWHCYEASYLTPGGVPVIGVLKIVVPASSPCIFESKSLKLYLFGMNMHTFDTPRDYTDTISKDLSECAGDTVFVDFFGSLDIRENSHESMYSITNTALGTFQDIDTLLGDDLYKMNITAYQEDRSLLTVDESNFNNKVMIPHLRSNCRVTKQPDWGDLYIDISPSITIVHDYPGGFLTREVWQGMHLGNLFRYVVSFREEAHFHEEIVERVYAALRQVYDPVDMVVAATYCRRGGIDIWPIRSSVKPSHGYVRLARSDELAVKPTYRL